MIITQPYTIHELDIDFNGAIRPNRLVGMLLTTAGMAADQCGFGIKDVMPQGLTWVLLRLTLQVKAHPVIGEQVNITTWIHDAQGLATTRYIKLSNLAGEDLAYCVTQWSLLNWNTRRPAPLETLGNVAHAIENDTLDITPVRVEAIEAEQTFEHTIGYNDIDFNCHANSLRYIEWMLDAYDKTFWETHRLDNLSINYLREGHWGENVTIAQQKKTEYDLYDLTVEGKSICKSRLGWKSL